MKQGTRNPMLVGNTDNIFWFSGAVKIVNYDNDTWMGNFLSFQLLFFFDFLDLLLTPIFNEYIHGAVGSKNVLLLSIYC